MITDKYFKMKKHKSFLWFFSVVCIFASCHDKEIAHPDFDYQTVYFGTQYPVRTLELGEDLTVDNSLDNQHKVSIKASLGGTRDNKQNVEIEIAVDESLASNLYFSAGGPRVLPMPSSYYKLTSNKIVIKPGNILGGVEVELTDDFFADPLSIKNTYAIPLLMKNVTGADSILKGSPSVSSPDRRVESNWIVKPLDYVLYVVKFINTWHGNYLRRGKDIITYQGDASPVALTRHAAYVEQDQVNGLTTKSLTEVNFPVTFKDKSGNNVSCTLLLKFDGNGACTISSGTSGVTASGTGSFVKKGDKKSWGNQDRDALYLDYQVSMSQLTASTKDTLVMRDRGVSPEYFTPVVQ